MKSHKLSSLNISLFLGVVEHADFREKDSTTSTDSRGGKMAKRILGAPLKLLSSDAFKSATSGNTSFLSAKAPWNHSRYVKTQNRGSQSWVIKAPSVGTILSN